jgi:predicted Zn finger-like uncharacterized protein
LITICPQCQLPLAVTAADLRIAQGQVRCGRCAAVFNALASLYEPGSVVGERRLPLAAPGTSGVFRLPSQAEGASGAFRVAPQAPAAGGPPRPASPAADAGNALRAPAPEVVAQALPEVASPPPSASGLFRAPPRDDEPRFDDTHGADDWPPETPALQLATAELQRFPEEADDAPVEGRAETTDTFIREALAAEELDLDLGESTDADADADGGGAHVVQPGSVVDVVAEAPMPAPPATPTIEPDAAMATAPEPGPEPEPESAAVPERDWAIDTMTAAELAALVARAERDEPPELASIRIAVDEASEITVLPSELPAPARAPVAVPPAQGAGVAATPSVPADATGAGSGRAPRPDGTFPRLLQPTDDDPDLAGARREAAERRAAMPRTGSTLRWLELEPAPPAGVPLPPATADTGTFAALGPAPLPAPPATPEALAPGALAAALGLDSELRPLATRPAVDDDTATPGDDTESGADAVVAELAASRGARGGPTPRWMWAATILLGVALAAQLVHLYREELAARPALREPLSRVYATLGRPLEPRWELGRYELRQQGVVAEPVAAGTLTVRASIRNGAERAQPAPLLRVTLQDRFGNRIATRDLTPREYGGTAAIAPTPMLAPGQRIDAEVSLLDPGGEAVGFELDVCLRRADGAVSCANDAPATRG